MATHPEDHDRGQRGGRSGKSGRLASLLALVSIAALVLLWRVFFGLQDAPTIVGSSLDIAATSDPAAAIMALERRLQVNPEDISALVEVGVLHFEAGEDYYPEAVNELEAARDLGAMDVRVFYCLGIIYQELGLYSFALTEYQRYLRNKPDDKEIRMLMAKLLYKRKRYAEAVSQYERLKFHFPQDGLVVENLGLSLWGAGLTARAVETFVDLKKHEGGISRRASYYLGQIAYEQARYLSAIKNLEDSTPGGNPPDFGIPPEKIFSSLAMTYAKLGRHTESQGAWERVLTYAPGDPKAQVALKQIKRRLRVKKKPKTARKT